MNVNVHIERLVLEGVPLAANRRAALQTAVEAELARLIGHEGLAPALLNGGAVPCLSGDTMDVPKQLHSADLGERIAQAVYGGIGG
jgi:hypothetical protein